MDQTQVHPTLAQIYVGYLWLFGIRSYSMIPENRERYDEIMKEIRAGNYTDPERLMKDLKDIQSGVKEIMTPEQGLKTADAAGFSTRETANLMVVKGERYGYILELSLRKLPRKGAGHMVSFTISERFAPHPLVTVNYWRYAENSPTLTAQLGAYYMAEHRPPVVSFLLQMMQVDFELGGDAIELLSRFCDMTYRIRRRW